MANACLTGKYVQLHLGRGDYAYVHVQRKTRELLSTEEFNFLSAVSGNPKSSPQDHFERRP